MRVQGRARSTASPTTRTPTRPSPHTAPATTSRRSRARRRGSACRTAPADGRESRRRRGVSGAAPRRPVTDTTTARHQERDPSRDRHARGRRRKRPRRPQRPRRPTRGSETGGERIVRRSRVCDVRSGAAIRARFTVDSTLGGTRDLTPYLTPTEPTPMRYLDVAGSGIREFPRKNDDLDTSRRGWTARRRIRNQQVSGSSPLAGSNRINDLQGSSAIGDCGRVGTM